MPATTNPLPQPPPRVFSSYKCKKVSEENITIKKNGSTNVVRLLLKLNHCNLDHLTKNVAYDQINKECPTICLCFVVIIGYITRLIKE